MHALVCVLMVLLPTAVLLGAGELAIGQRSLDLIGHIWTIWVASEGSLTQTPMAAHPHGADLLPILGGWLDIFVASVLTRGLGLDPITAYNAVVWLWLVVAGWGGWCLARALGAGRGAAMLSGAVLQLDGYALHHLNGGRTEQAGVGFLALALAGALYSWQKPSRWGVIGCGVAGALVVFLSWEHAIWLALAMLWMTPFVWKNGRPQGAWKRWSAAAGVTVLLAGGWAGMFVQRAAAVRHLDEGRQTLSWAVEASVAPLSWFSQSVRPATMTMAALAVVFWLVPRTERWLWRGIGLGLLLSALLAMGPSPGLWQPGDLREGFWGPFAWMQVLPMLGWFHTPDRLMVGWSLAGSAAVALVAERLWKWQWWAGLATGAAVLIGTAHHCRAGALWPTGGWRPGGPAALAVIAAESEGALLDLPPAQAGMDAMQYTIFQMLHQRPIPFHMTLPFLTHDAYGPLAEQRETLRWLAGPPRQSPPQAARDDLLSLQEDGFRWVVLHPNRLPPPMRMQAQQLFHDALGSPDLMDPSGWMCWDLQRR